MDGGLSIGVRPHRDTALVIARSGKAVRAQAPNAKTIYHSTSPPALHFENESPILLIVK